jgi:hypothetical protein
MTNETGIQKRYPYSTAEIQDQSHIGSILDFIVNAVVTRTPGSQAKNGPSHVAHLLIHSGHTQEMASGFTTGDPRKLRVAGLALMDAADMLENAQEESAE